MSRIAYLNELPVKYDKFPLLDPGGIDFDRMGRNIKARNRLRRKYSWAIPNEEALAAILAASKKVVEIGAGSGYWAHLLTERGGTVRAYDNGSWSMHAENPKWFPVTKGGPGMVRFYPDAVVLLCWPPYDEPMAFDSARRMVVGQTLAYVGESSWGCTGDDSFHELLAADFEEVNTVAIPRWEGLNDHLTIYERRRR